MSAGPLQSGKKSAAPWPTAAQFNEAVQNLRTSMADDELQGGAAAVNSQGLPMLYSGGFADVYQVHCPSTGNTWAVKCFTKGAAGLRERYAEISRCLAQARLPFMVDFRYLDEGVRIAGAWYPIVKMRWIEGQNLNRFVAQALDQPAMLDQLFNLWVKLAGRLRFAGIAHADLQHGNVVLVPKGDQGLLLKLIDYDGMYVPALAGLGSGEVGHRNYQHPQRAAKNIHSAEVDRFSHLAICCAVRCLRAGGRRLWEQFNTDENLLFKEQDFLNPAGSELFRELWTLRRQPEVHALVGHLALATQRPLEQTPLLETLVSNGRVRRLTPDELEEVGALLRGNQVGMVVENFSSVLATSESTATEPSALAETRPAHAAKSLPPAIPSGADAAEVELVEEPPVHVPARKPRRDWKEILATSRAFVAWPVARVDRTLGLLAGEDNAILHNFFRVLLALVLVVGVAWATMPAVSYVQSWFTNAHGDQLPLAELDGQSRAARADSLKMKLVYIPPGEFEMGSPESEKNHQRDEKLHRVRLTKGFYLGIYEVTQGEYEQVMGKNPSHFSPTGGGKGSVQGLDTSRLPVENVSWEDATAFCKKLSAAEGRTYRLPTEAEWEYACRARTKTAFHFGDMLNGDQANCDGSSPYGTNVKGKYLKRITTVGSYAPNAFGLYDMHGNVWEWCSDRHADYAGDADDPQGPDSGVYRVIRGGSWSFIASAVARRSAAAARPRTVSAAAVSVSCVSGRPAAQSS